MTAAMIGDETLVPPTLNQPGWPLNGVVSYTATPVAGSATADTSAIACRPQPASPSAPPPPALCSRSHGRTRHGLVQDVAMTVTARLDLAIFDAADIEKVGSFYADLTGWDVVRQDADR